MCNVLHHNRFELRRPQEGLHNPRTDLCLRFLQRLHDRAHGRFLVAGFAIPGHHGHVPVDLRVRLDHLFSLVHALVTRVCTDIGLISTELLAGVETEAWCCHRDSCPRPHRGRRIRDTSACAQRLFHRWVREVEPLLATVDAQYGGDCEWRAATCGTGQWSVPGNPGDQFGPTQHQVHIVQRPALARALGLAFESTLAQACLLRACNVSHLAGHAEVLQTSLRQIVLIYLAFAPILFN